MMQGKFTQKAQEVIRAAQNNAAAMGHNYVGTEHLLLGILRESSGTAVVWPGA